LNSAQKSRKSIVTLSDELIRCNNWILTEFFWIQTPLPSSDKWNACSRKLN